MKRSIFADVNLREAQKLVGQLRPEDGVDPRDEAKRRRKERRAAGMGVAHGIHKQEQFLTQVQAAIEAALQTSASPLLNSLTVRDVAQQGGSLVVAVAPQESGETVDLKAARQALEQSHARLRREVAAAITRKETPNLSFVLLPSGAAKLPE